MNKEFTLEELNALDSKDFLNLISYTGELPDVKSDVPFVKESDASIWHQKYFYSNDGTFTYSLSDDSHGYLFSPIVFVNDENREAVITHFTKHFPDIVKFIDFKKLKVYDFAAIAVNYSSIVMINANGLNYTAPFYSIGDSKHYLNKNKCFYLIENGIIPRNRSSIKQLETIKSLDIASITLGKNNIAILDDKGINYHIPLEDYVSYMISGDFDHPVDCYSNTAINKNILNQIIDTCVKADIKYKEFTILGNFKSLAIHINDNTYIVADSFNKAVLAIESTVDNFENIVDTYVKVIDVYRDLTKFNYNGLNRPTLLNVWNSVAEDNIKIERNSFYGRKECLFNFGSENYSYFKLV